jgi:hypothetical protein
LIVSHSLTLALVLFYAIAKGWGGKTGGAKSAVPQGWASAPAPPDIASVKIPSKGITFLNQGWSEAQGQTPHGASNSWQYYVDSNKQTAPVLISHVDDHPGQVYQNIDQGDVVYIRTTKGEQKAYIVREVRDYQYSRAKKGQERSVDALSNVGSEHHRIPVRDAYRDATRNKEAIVFQTCITDRFNWLTGQKFVVAVPAPAGYSGSPPPKKVLAQRK